MQKTCRKIIQNRLKCLRFPPQLPCKVALPQELSSTKEPWEGTKVNAPAFSLEAWKEIRNIRSEGLSSLFTDLEKILESGDKPQANRKAKDALKHSALQDNLSDTYETFIFLFAKHRDWASVCLFWREMCSYGFIPSNKVRTMLIPLLLSLPTDADLKIPEEQLSGLKKEVMQDLYPDEGFICSLLSKMSKNGTEPSSCEDVLRNYATLRGLGWWPSLSVARTMASMYIRTGSMSGFLRWARHAEKLVPKIGGSDQPTPAHFSRFLDLAMSKVLFDRSKSQQLEALIDHEIDNGRRPDSVALNILLNTVVHQRDFEATQRVFKKMCLSVLPDTYAFTSMFKAYEFQRKESILLRNDSVVTSSQVRLRPRPRTLFGQLLQVHTYNSKRFVTTPYKASFLFTQDLLYRILRSYLTLQDYAACLISLETFSTHHVIPTTASYRLIWNMVVQRIVKQSVHHKLLRNSSYIKSVSLDIKPRYRKWIRHPNASERELTWAGRMIDELDCWEDMFTVQRDLTSDQRSVSGKGPKGLIMPYPELSQRIERRLRILLFHILRKDLLPRQRISEGSDQSTSPSEDVFKESNYPDEPELVYGLLRRAIIMQRIPALNASVAQHHEIFQRELENARRDMSTCTLPTLPGKKPSLATVPVEIS